MKFAICNELFEGWTFADTCAKIREIGYTGVEIAPFTLAPRVDQVTREQRNAIKRAADEAGIAILGLHWLLARLEGFHINSPDSAIRRKTADYLRAQVDLCGDISGTLMVFGSPGARKVLPDVSIDDAFEYAADTLRQITPTLADRGVTFCLEPLSTAETNFLNSADEGARLMDMVDHPRVRLHLDVKAMSAEKDSIPAIIRKHHGHTGHFHANDPNLRGPGMGEVDFTPIFATLREVGYPGWVSVEVFDFKPDPVTIAMESLAYMRKTSGVEV